MSTREPNKRQYLFCQRCQRITKHTTDDAQNSDWVTLAEGIWAYKQSRDCTVCGGASGEPGESVGWQSTIEMTERDFNRVVEELVELRKFRDSAMIALEAFRDSVTTAAEELTTAIPLRNPESGNTSDSKRPSLLLSLH
jgi:hypothetical protein